VAGEWGRALKEIRGPLVELRAELEGELEFPDEAEPTPEVSERLEGALAAARSLGARAARESLLRRGARVALYGPVNAGKSSLFNALLGEARALVDEEPGTTRDVLEARLELDGMALTLLDTAGLREASGRVEAEGIGRALAAVNGADLALLVTPPGTTDAEAAGWRALAARVEVLAVASKADLGQGTGALGVSARTGTGLDVLRAELSRRLAAGAAAAALASRDRHVDALRRVGESLERALGAARASTLEVVSGEVGLALDALGELTGETASEELLDAIFARFCIGK